MHVHYSHTGVGGGVSTGVLLPGSGVGRTHHHGQLQQVQQQLSQVGSIYTENDVFASKAISLMKYVLCFLYVFFFFFFFFFIGCCCCCFFLGVLIVCCCCYLLFFLCVFCVLLACCFVLFSLLFLLVGIFF